MIQKIFEIILGILNFIISLIIQLVMNVFPDLGLAELSEIIATFYELINKGINFIYFIFGETTAPIFIGIITTLLSIKHVILPTINLVRKFFIK